MCDQDKFARMLIKQGNGAPTIPPSADHRNGDWPDTAIYEGEFYQDLDTGKIYNRLGSTIVDASGLPMTVSVVLNKSEVNALNVTPFIAFTLPAGVGARFVKPPVVKIFSDGSNFTTGSGESIQIHNSESAGSGNFLASWGDPLVTGADAPYSSQTFLGYRMVTGDHTIIATFAIGGGGAAATMTFYMDYELYAL